MSNNWGVVEDVINRLNEAAIVSGATNKIWKDGSFGTDVKRMMYKRVVVPTGLLGVETGV